MTHLVCIVEEPSAEEMLKGVLPRIFPDMLNITYIVFQGKQDLEKNVARRIKGWMHPDSYFLVMRDQDCGNCITIKSGLQQKIQATGKADKVLIRIVCRELESFYLGDLAAVEHGLSIPNIAQKQRVAKFRQPDNLPNAAQELRALTMNKYQKLSGSRAIAPHFRTDGVNRSQSFDVLLQGLRAILGYA